MHCRYGDREHCDVTLSLCSTTELGHELPSREQLTPEALGRLQRAEIEKWAPVVKAANIKPE